MPKIHINDILYYINILQQFFFLLYLSSLGEHKRLKNPTNPTLAINDSINIAIILRMRFGN